MENKSISVAELIEKLSHIRNKQIKVFMVPDSSEENYDEEGKIIKTYPIELVEREKYNSNDGWENETVEDVLLIAPNL